MHLSPQRLPDSTWRGATCIVASAFGYALLEALVKQLTGSYGAAQILFLRSSLSLVLVLPLLWSEGGLAALRTRRLGLHLLRGLLGAAALGAVIQALSYMALSDVVAIVYLAPILTVLWCRWLLKERPTRAALVGLSCSIAGVTLVLWPSGEVFELAALLPVLAAICLSFYLALVPLGLQRETSSALFFYSSLIPALASGFAAALDWRPIAGSSLPIFALLGLVAGLALVLRNAGYQRYRVNTLASFEYTGILWAAILGVLLFDEWPRAQFYCGATLLVVGNLYHLLAKNRSKQRKN